MKILAIETGTDISSIAVADDSGVLGQYDFAHRMDLSRRLMPNVISLLRDSGTELRDLEAVGVSLGPGSFTGLRIGVVTAKTIAQVLGVPIAGVVSLDLLAHQFDYLPDAVVCPLIKVRKGEVYYAFFRTHGGSLERLSDYGAGPTEQLVKQARTLGLSQVIFCGDGLTQSLDDLRESLGDVAIPAPEWLSYPKAGILARLSADSINRGETADPLSLAPFYIRRSAPEMRAEQTCY